MTPQSFIWRSCDRLNKGNGDIIGGKQNTPNRKNGIVWQVKVTVRRKPATIAKI